MGKPALCACVLFIMQQCSWLTQISDVHSGLTGNATPSHIRKMHELDFRRTLSRAIGWISTLRTKISVKSRR
jgi:hypothetical protein